METESQDQIGQMSHISEGEEEDNDGKESSNNLNGSEN